VEHAVVIGVELVPGTIRTDRAVDVTIRVTNQATHPIRKVVVQLDPGTAAVVVAGALEIERDVLEAGATAEWTVGMRGREPGSAEVSVPNVSYRVRGESVRQRVEPLPLTVVAREKKSSATLRVAHVQSRPLVFVSYRRSAGRSFPQLLVDRLRQHLDAEVFFDRDAIQSGDKWRQRIDDALNRATALLAVIDPGWEGPRISQEGDVLRHEIATALQRGILVLPVLYSRADRPSTEQLPSDLADLLETDIARVDDRVLNDDLTRIVVALRRAGIRPARRSGGARR
jgi:hypothetical protein